MWRVAIVGALFVVLAGCERTDLDVYRCADPDVGHEDADGKADPCHRNDPSVSDAGATADAGDGCDGVCVPIVSSLWAGPALVWMGAEADAPSCPPGATFPSYTGRGDPGVLPPLCGACACAPPTGSCELPATVTAAAASCAGDGPGVAHISFDPPATWGGTCTAGGAISAGPICGGVPCVQSVTIAPLKVKESMCLPIEPANTPKTPLTWGIFARVCIGTLTSNRCGMVDTVCAPTTPEPNFKQCILRYGDPDAKDLKCPPTYPNRGVFYSDFIDTRTCSACECAPPTGSTCAGSISIFADGVCGPSLVVSAAIDTISSQCHDVPPGTALGSKSASQPIYTAGSCVATGGVEMKASPKPATIICCRDTP